MTEAARGTDSAIAGYLAGVASDSLRIDATDLIAILGAATGRPANLWGSMVGFGRYHYRYASGREGDGFLVGFAARKVELVLYLSGLGFADVAPQVTPLLARLGKHRQGKGCLYLKRLGDIDTEALVALVQLSVTRLKQEYGEVD